VINYRYAEGKFERLPALAAELVALKADVIVAGATPAALAAKQATKIIPIVFASGGDPVTDGLVTSLARPGSNVTGLTGLVPELIGKCLEHRAFSDMTKARLGALTVLTSPMLFSERRRLVDLAATNRLPTVYTLREFVDAGGLISYGPNAADLYRRAATYVDKILKGAKPSDLPVEQPTKFELVINLKTAKAFGLTIPPSLLARADHVVEKRASAAAERSGR
jgi:putative ABC transport system substrate-binding protein